MQPLGVLYDSLPVMRLGVRNDDETVVVAPDFSTFAYMLEEYIALAVAYIFIPSSSPEVKRFAELPLLLQKRVRVFNDSYEVEAVSRLLYPAMSEMGVKESNDLELQFPKEMSQERRKQVSFVRQLFLKLAIGFNHGMQINIPIESARTVLRNLRENLYTTDARAIIAQLEGVFAVYGEVTYDSLHPRTTSPLELITLFDRLEGVIK